MSTKKVKKQKGKTISLQEFAASLEPATTAGQNVIYAPKQVETVRSWADEVEEDDYAAKDKVRIVLPSAPRASRGPDFDESQITKVPPFIAHIGNISYDIDDEDIYDFFKALDITELRLPRDTNNRLRGFGYVQFQTRDHLIDALCMNEQMLRGRPLRISPGQGGEGGDRRGGGRGGHIDETPDDWRASEKTDFGPPRVDSERSDYRGRSDFGGGRSDYGSQGGGSEFGRRPFGSRNDFDRGGDFGGRRGGDFDRDRSRTNYGQRDDYERSDYGSRRGGGFGRNYDQSGGEAEEEGPWRRNPVQKVEPQDDRRYGNSDRDPQDQERRYGGPDRDAYNQDRRYGSRDNDLHDQDRRYGGRDRDPSPDFTDARTRQPRIQSPEFERTRPPPSQSRQDDESEREREPRKPSPPRERKKLVIAPRTITESTSSVVSSSAIFGGARPVDTAAREREIERKLAEQNEEPKRVRILPRPKTEIKKMEVGESTPTSLPPLPPITNERVPPTPLVIPKSSQNSKESSKLSEENEFTPAKPSEPQPPPPIINAWNERRERQESRFTNREPPESHVTKPREHSQEHPRYEDEDQHDTSLTRGSDRDDQHSPPPDSDHKDTNSEPEDERDLRLQQESDDFQRVERRGRKPKPPPPVEQIQRSEYNRGGSGGNYGRGGRGARRGNN